MLTYTEFVGLVPGARLAVTGDGAEAVRRVLPAAAILLGGHRQGAPPRRWRRRPLRELLVYGARRIGRRAKNRLDGKAGNRAGRALAPAVFCATHSRFITV